MQRPVAVSHLNVPQETFEAVRQAPLPEHVAAGIDSFSAGHDAAAQTVDADA